jgi:hypothetical protein
MTATMSSDDVVSDLMAQIARIAPAKRHRLSADMVNGSRYLTEQAARKVLSHLAGCPDKAEVPAEAIQSAGGTGRAAPRGGISAEPLPPLRAFADIPVGFYATPSLTGAQDLDFWKVTRGKDGTQWEGVPFAARVLGGGDGKNLRTERIGNIQQRIALRAIRDAGPDTAKRAFADKLKHCTECGLPLTDQVSRDAGMGPTCRDKKAVREGGA